MLAQPVVAHGLLAALMPMAFALCLSHESFGCLNSWPAQVHALLRLYWEMKCMPLLIGVPFAHIPCQYH